jgi:hypothetical protein
VLLDLLLQHGSQRDPRLLEEPDLHDLGIAFGRPHVEAGVVAVRLQEMPADRGGQDAEVGDVDARGVDAGDHRALDHPTGRGRLPARDHAGAALERRPKGSGEADGHLGCDVDLDEPGDAVLAEQARGRARLPDQALVDVRAALDLLVRVDADAGHDLGLGADRHLVADRDAFVDADVRAQIAVAADHGALDDRAGPDVRRRVDHGAARAGAVAQRDAVAEDRVRRDRGLR